MKALGTRLLGILVTLGTTFPVFAGKVKIPVENMFENCGVAFQPRPRFGFETSTLISGDAADFKAAQGKIANELLGKLSVDMHLHASPYGDKLPYGVPNNLTPLFRIVLNLAQDPVTMIKMLKQFELEVYEWATSKKMGAEDAFSLLLSQYELKAGFGREAILSKAIDPQQRMEYVRKKIPVKYEYLRGTAESADGERLFIALAATQAGKIFGNSHILAEAMPYIGDENKARDLDWSSFDFGKFQPRQPGEDLKPRLFNYLFRLHQFREARMRPATFSNGVYFGSLRNRFSILTIGWE